MTENEAIERIKLSCIDCGSDDCGLCDKATEMAIQALEKQSMVNEILSELREYSQIGTVEEFKALKNKHIGKDNMVISSSDLMTILNSDSEELKQYKEVGTVEEFKALKEENSELHNEAQAERAFLTERDAEIRANAIDEFASAILQKFTEEGRNGNYRFYSCKIKKVITDLAEQFKGGAV